MGDIQAYPTGAMVLFVWDDPVGGSVTLTSPSGTVTKIDLRVFGDGLSRAEFIVDEPGRWTFRRDDLDPGRFYVEPAPL